MPKPKWNLNNIYISERLQENLRPISRCAFTTVVAPMGYGKTTAVNWYLEERSRTEKIRVIRISVYSDNLVIFWKSVQDAFLRAGCGFIYDYSCPTDSAGGGMLADDICHELAGDVPCYIFIDDFHLLTDERATAFLCMLSNRLPTNIHLIVASRDRFLPAAEILRLGSKVYQIGTEQLRLNHTELAVYAHRCGTELSQSQIEKLLYSSEGWFSAVYLNLRTFYESGELPDRESDIYSTFTAAMISPLPENQREFLAVMGLADEFTIEMARYVTENDDTDEILDTLTAQNAFVKRLSVGNTYRFHHMLKECAEHTFQSLPEEKQARYLENYGAWYEEHKQYIHSMSAYRRGGDFDALLEVIRKDKGILLSSLEPRLVLSFLDECSEETLKKHPFAVLVLMRCMFNWRQIPKMMQLKALLMSAIDEHTEISAEERGNLIGECDLIMSFLFYNDISAMSRLHRSASSQMSRPAISIQNSGGWTFGSPSVLMMFYRGAGELEAELCEMDECMPHYYKITEGHGQGAERIMRAEAYFMQGKFTDAHIELESAYAEIEGNGQENMALCCDFLACRLSLFDDIEERYTFEERYSQLLKHHNSAWLNIWSATATYYYALCGKVEKIPEVFASHRLSAMNILSPGKPMYEMIENQVYLAQGAYAKVIGRSTEQLSVCEAMHYALVSLHVKIQTAAAYEMLGKRSEAAELITCALNTAEVDNIAMPFAENYRYIKDLLDVIGDKANPFVGEVIRLGRMYEERQKQIDGTTSRPQRFNVLTEREYEIVGFMSERLSNREIAEKLFLTEGSVKQYIKQIYSKLGIEGDTRTKRRQLSELMEDKD